MMGGTGMVRWPSWSVSSVGSSLISLGELYPEPKKEFEFDKYVTRGMYFLSPTSTLSEIAHLLRMNSGLQIYLRVVL